MSNFTRRTDLIDRKKEPDDFLHISADFLIRKFKTENIEILPAMEAADKIRAHPKCPFYKFAFTGECELDRVWYYIAGSGALHIPTTRVLLLRRDAAV